MESLPPVGMIDPTPRPVELPTFARRACRRLNGFQRSPHCLYDLRLLFVLRARARNA